MGCKGEKLSVESSIDFLLQKKSYLKDNINLDLKEFMLRQTR